MKRDLAAVHMDGDPRASGDQQTPINRSFRAGKWSVLQLNVIGRHKQLK